MSGRKLLDSTTYFGSGVRISLFRVSVINCGELLSVVKDVSMMMMMMMMIIIIIIIIGSFLYY